VITLDKLGRIDDVTYMAWCLGVDVGKLGVEAAPGPPAAELRLLTCDHALLLLQWVGVVVVLVKALPMTRPFEATDGGLASM